ncbi:MAG: molybdopterin-synthase adenylyltransferase MoeB [Actinomycetia bacterium]|nr:molybdopterin-synthase adenylyltransferase MoeB [Actinomycetes bacterium]
MTQIAHETDPDDIDPSAFDMIIDVRPHGATSARLQGSIFVRLEELLASPATVIETSNTRVLVTCDVGLRSAIAVERLRTAGYFNTTSLRGGIDAWRRSGLPLSGADGLTSVQLERYDRHLKLGFIGAEGQSKLLAANVVVVGAGGLGSPVIAYLAAAGVGTLTIIDDDTVDSSNLQRQPIHGIHDLANAKVDSAEAFIRSLNPDVQVVTHRTRLETSNAAELLAGATVVVDASDNFAARHAINAAAVAHGVPVAFASVYRMEGQISVFDASRGPCYRCVFPDMPDVTIPLDCLTVGVLGSVTGILGSMQATEAIKLIVGNGQSLLGTLVLYDGMRQEFTRLPVSKDPACSVCGDQNA